MNIKRTCQEIDSLLGSLSATGIQPIPDLVFQMRTLLREIESVEQPKRKTSTGRKLVWFFAFVSLGTLLVYLLGQVP